jgi:IMP dehydrogenase/GMP reductase
MKKLGSFKEDLNNSPKEIQENKGKQLETLKEEKNKSLKEIQKNTIKLVKELNKVVQNVKAEIETIKNTNRGNP